MSMIVIKNLLFYFACAKTWAMLADENKKKKQIAIVESVIQFGIIFHDAIDNLVLHHKEKEGSSNHWYYSDPIEKPIKIKKQKRGLKHVLIKLGVLLRLEHHFVYKDTTKFSILDRHRGYCKINSIIFSQSKWK